MPRSASSRRSSISSPHGVIEPGALYEPPFTSIHAGGPDALFSGKSRVIDGIFERVHRFETGLSETG